MAQNSTEVYTKRRHELARLDHDNCDMIPVSEAALTLDVSEGQISQDRKSSEYLDERTRVGGQRRKRILAKSWKMVEAVIDAGLEKDSKEADINRASNMVQFVINRTKEADSADEDSTHADFIAKMFGPDTSELRRGNEELKARLATIEERVTKLNGVGAEIIKTTGDEQ